MADVNVPDNEVSPEEREFEDKLLNFLGGVMFPVTQDGLIDLAIESGADQDIVEALEDMPDITYEKQEDILEAIRDLRSRRVEESA